MTHREGPHCGDAVRLAVIVALLAAGTTVLASQARGQSPPAPIEGPEPGSTPPLAYTKVQITKGGEFVRRVWIPRDDVSPLARPKADSPQASNGSFAGKSLPFMYPAAMTASKDGFLLLVQVPALQAAEDKPVAQIALIGWVPASKVIASNKAPKDRQTELPSQCLLVNRFDKDRNPLFSETVQYRSRPDAKQGESRGSDNLRAQCYVFAEQGEGEDGWLLLGREPDFESSSNDARPARRADQVVRGWVPKSRTLRVVTREYLEWDVRTTWPQRRYSDASPRPLPPGPWVRREPDGKVFEDDEAHEKTRTALLKSPTGAGLMVPVRESLQYVTENGKWAPTEEKPKTTGPVLRVSRSLDARGARYPLLEIKDLSTADELVRHVEHVSKNKLYRVGAFGNLGTGQNGGQLVLDPEIEQIRTVLEKIREEAKSIQVVIVIDKTRSMEPYYPAVADFVNSLVDLLRTRRGDVTGRTIELAVSFYDDNEDGVNGEQFPMVKLEDGAAVAAMLERIRRPAIEASNRGVKELVFDGILQALNKVEDQFVARHNATRFLVVIGDQGDDDGKPDPYPFSTTGPDGRPAGPPVPNVRNTYPNPARQPGMPEPEERIARRLSRVDSGGNYVRMLAVQVIRPDKRPDIPDLEPAIFKRQMEDIITRLNKFAKPEGEKLSDDDSLGHYQTLNFSPDERPGLVDDVRKKKLFSTLTEQFDRLKQRVGVLERQLDDLQAGAQTGSVWTPDLELLVKNNGIDIADFLKKVRARPIFAVEGYVWEFEPARGGKALGPRQVRPVVKISKTEAEGLRNMLQPFFETLGVGSSPNKIRAARRALEAITGRGEDRSGQRDRKPWQTILFQSPLLQVPPDQITDTMIEENLPELELRYKRLVDLLDIDANNMSIQRVWRAEPGSSGPGSYKVVSYPHPDGPKARRLNDPNNEEDYCWLSLDEEMP